MSIKINTSVVMLSGGLDSAVLLWHMKALGQAQRAVTIDYGQRNRIEITHAKRLARIADVEHDVVDFARLAWFLPGNSQTDPRVQVPVGGDEEANMRATRIPNRNMILLAVALGIAIAHGIESVAYGSIVGDGPDNRPAFVAAMELAAKVCDYDERRILAPFVTMTKATVVALGAQLSAPLDLTWSCFTGGRDVGLHCGACRACLRRKAAFLQAEIKDPTTYA